MFKIDVAGKSKLFGGDPKVKKKEYSKPMKTVSARAQKRLDYLDVREKAVAKKIEGV
jgi:hypothetical protein